MTETAQPFRRVVRVDDSGSFKPFDRYGKTIAGMTWLPLSYDGTQRAGTFLLRMAPGARSLPHEHPHGEEFLMLEGELVDNDGTVFRTGDYVGFAPGSRHFSVAPGGCLIAVFMRGPNRPLDAAEIAALPRGD
jgi:quercetin dioxygenase-like cupin family protein